MQTNMCIEVRGGGKTISLISYFEVTRQGRGITKNGQKIWPYFLLDIHLIPRWKQSIGRDWLRRALKLHVSTERFLLMKTYAVPSAIRK